MTSDSHPPEWVEPIHEDDRIQAATIDAAIRGLKNHLTGADDEIRAALNALNGLYACWAIEYVEGTEGADLYHYLQEAARAVRAARALNDIPARNSGQG